jgi:hypothetical protein
LLVALWAYLCAGGLAASAGFSQDPVLENRLKAAVASKFPQFVEWPEHALSGRPALGFCVAQPDPYGADLDTLVAGETAQGRPLVVRRLRNAAALGECHVLLIPAGGGRQRELLLEAASQPILTVGDSGSFLDEGGMVVLRLVGGRVRFDVNARAARNAGLRISSQLLRLAVKVHGGEQ